MQEHVKNLNAPTKKERLAALQQLKNLLTAGAIEKPVTGTDVNNHIHTTYSFSPYSPTKAVWMAYMAGLSTAGIVDHDSVSGANEFIEAANILDFPVTVGFELRVRHTATKLGQRRTNNPDQKGISYLTFHGIPHTRIETVSAFLKPISVARGMRNKQMCLKISELMGISIDYETDILPLSEFADGGSVTERHLLYGLSLKLIEKYKKGEALVAYLQKIIDIPPNLKTVLQDLDNPYYAYDLLGLLKSNLVAQIYVDADDTECPEISDVVGFARDNGIILTYPYLGDVTASITGDKKPQTFEDEFLDELFETLVNLGFQAVSYMPSRNTMEQLTRLRKLCDQFSMLQISGEDINTPRQSFICTAMRNEVFANLVDTTWALIGHESAATKDLALSFPKQNMTLQEKIQFYKKLLP